MGQGLAGRLRTRLGVERFTMAGADGAGGFAGGWSPAGSVWAEMADAGETAIVEGDGRVRRPRWTVTAREGAVDATCRLRWRGRAFAVLGVRHDPATPDRMTLHVEEVAA